jgi:hypothetical protein
MRAAFGQAGHPLVSVSSLVLGLCCSLCLGSAPMPVLTGLHAVPPAARWSKRMPMEFLHGRPLSPEELEMLRQQIEEGFDNIAEVDPEIGGKLSAKSRDRPTRIKISVLFAAGRARFGIPLYPRHTPKPTRSPGGIQENGSSLAAVRRLFGEKSDECLLNMRLSPLWGISGYRGRLPERRCACLPSSLWRWFAGRQGP